MSWQAGAAEGWAERDLRDIELKAASTQLGVEAVELEALLPALLTLDCARLQLQPLLEQAWTRLVALREQLAELRGEIDDPHAGSAIDDARHALKAGGPDTLPRIVQALTSAHQSCIAAGASERQLASLHGLQALAAAITFDFPSAIAASEEATRLADDDASASWRHRTLQAECLLDQGREFIDVDALQNLKQLCEDTLLPMASSDEQRAWVYDCLGQALGLIGRQHSGTAFLSESVDAFERALSLRSRDRDAFAWAATQNHLGNAIGSLGQRQQELELLERAVTAFEAAVQSPVSNAGPESRASAHSNLAAVRQTLGQVKQDPMLMKRAVDSYRTALSIWTSERKPIFWAATMSNVGGALRQLGALNTDADALSQAVSAYQTALSVRSRDRMPRDWAKTQNDLGAALQALGEMTEDALTFGRAISAYREALKEITRDNEPMTYAMTMANLAVARRKYAEYTGDAEVARRAVGDIQAALEVFRGASHARYTDLALEQLAIAMEVSVELATPEQD